MVLLIIAFSLLSFIIGAFLVKIITANRFSSTKHLLENKITTLETKLNSSYDLISNITIEKNELKNKNEELLSNSIKLISENRMVKEYEKQILTMNENLNEKNSKIEQLMNENLQLEKLTSQLKTTIEKEDIASTEKLELLTKAHQMLKQEFENISNKIFDEKNSKLVEQNKVNLNLILNPLKDQIDGFRKKVEDVYDKESKERTSLKTEITSLKELNSRISNEAANLTSAIKGDKKMQGIWGEIILEHVLESSGLRKGHEYQTKHTQ